MTPLFHHLNRSTLLVAFLFGLSMAGHAQWPYNPDADNDSLIGSGDIIELLTIFGMPWEGEGILGIESGGTGAASVDAARDSLRTQLYFRLGHHTGHQHLRLDLGGRRHARDGPNGARAQCHGNRLFCLRHGRRQ